MLEAEYTEVLDHLLKRLIEIGRSNIAEQINRQISRGKTVTVKDASDLLKMKIKQSEVGKTQTLPLTSKEALEIAIDYLSKIIIDVPSYSKSIGKTFGKNIRWEYDQTQSLQSLNTSESFSLATITFNEKELEIAKSELLKIKTYLKE